MRDDEPPAWFWETLERARPDLNALAAALEEMSREQLIEFARIYRDAASEVCDYWSGPVVDGVQFSEDDAEDLANWVVSVGQEYWRAAVSTHGQLDAVVRDYRDAAAQGRAWSTSVARSQYHGHQSPEAIPYAVFQFRFDEDLLAVLEERDAAS